MEIKWLRPENTKNALFCPFLDFKVRKWTKKEASPDPLEPLPNPHLKGGNIHFFLTKSGIMATSKKKPCLDLEASPLTLWAYFIIFTNFAGWKQIP